MGNFQQWQIPIDSKELDSREWEPVNWASGDPDAEEQARQDADLALAGLDEGDAALLRAYYLLGLTQDELAAVLGVSQATICFRLRRAKMRAAGTWTRKPIRTRIREDQASYIVDEWRTGKYKSLREIEKKIGRNYVTIRKVLLQAGIRSTCKGGRKRCKATD